MIELILTKYNYIVVIVLMMTGLYAVMANDNLIKKIIGINIFQTAVFLFYISISKLAGATTPVLMLGAVDVMYDNPLPQVLVLTAIVVGVSITSVSLAIILLIHREYGTLEEDEILEMNKQQ